MPPELTDAHDLIDLQKVAQRLGITPLFLRWSLDAGLPLIFQNKDGLFSVSMGRGEAASKAPAQSAAELETPPPDVASPEVASPLAPPRAAAPDPAAPPTQQGEIDFLRRHLSSRDGVAADKDKLLAELALRIAALGETAIERGFSALTALHGASGRYEPRQTEPNQPYPNDRGDRGAGHGGTHTTSPQAQPAAPAPAASEPIAPRIPLPPHPLRTDPTQDEINRRHELAIENIRDTLILIRNYLAQIDPLAGDKP